MKGTLHVAARTIVERRNVFVAAAVAALLPFLYSILPWVGAENAEELRTASALVIAAGLSLAVALLYGATCLARDLREQRLSFFFSRPLPALSLWAGRVLAGLLLAGATLLIVLLPSMLLGPGWRATNWSLVELVAGAAAGILVAVALGHALAVMLASRSGWLAVDLAAVVIVGVGAATILRLIVNTGDSSLLTWFTRVLVIGAAAGLVAAGLAQLALGRTDVRTGHRALSLTLWATCVATLVVLAGYTLFLLDPTPRSLTSVNHILAAPGGDVIVVSGRTRWRGWCEAAFAIDTASGRHTRLGRPSRSRQPSALSADGSRVVWLESLGSPWASPVRVMMLDLSHGDSRPRETRIVLDRYGANALAISSDGHRIALLEGELLTAYELDSGRLLASARLVEKGRTLMAFVTSDRLKVEQRVEPSGDAPKVLVVSALDLSSRRISETGRRALSKHGSFIVARSADSGSVVMRNWLGNEVTSTLHDGWTLAQRAELLRASVPSWSRHSPPLTWSEAVLADGRIVIGEADRRGSRLSIYTPAGVAERVLDLGLWRKINVGEEVAPGRLAVSLARTASVGNYRLATQWDECSAVDLASGRRTPIGKNLVPLAEPWFWFSRPHVRPGSVASRLFLAPGRLLIWDPADPAVLRSVLETGRD